MLLSVIIPALNERSRIADSVHRVLLPAVHEVIVADGGSADGTRAEAESAGARVVRSAPGRGVQQNAGASAAGGNVYLFLHADTRLPDDFVERVAETIDSPGVSGGAFRFRLDQRGPAMRLIEWMVDCRSRLLQMPYGDQAIFVRAETFRLVGGFPDTPIMEDCELIRRLRRVGRIAIADGDAVTSARRYRRMGWWRATWTNQAYLIAYRLNVAPERIARWRAGC